VVRLGQSAVRLAEIDLPPGEQRELGSLTVPAPGTLRISAAGLAPLLDGKAPNYTLYVRFGEERAGRTLEVGHGSLDGEELLTLLPGNYGLLVFDGSSPTPRRHAVHVTSYEETRLHLGQ
jgi:hypothetical protein